MRPRMEGLGRKAVMMMALAAAGALTGAALQPAVRPAPVQAYCERDECELNTRCKAVAQKLICDVKTTGGCETVPCEGGEVT